MLSIFVPPPPPIASSPLLTSGMMFNGWGFHAQPVYNVQIYYGKDYKL